MNQWSKFVIGAVAMGFVASQAVIANEEAHPAAGDAAVGAEKNSCKGMGEKNKCKGKAKHHKKGKEACKGKDGCKGKEAAPEAKTE